MSKETPRRQARRRAVEVLFEADQRGVAAVELVPGRLDDVDPDARGYVGSLVRGVVAHAEEISEWLDTYSQGWPQDRMPAVDRAVLYLGAYEVVFEDDVPDEVVMAEAADLVADLSTDKSANFVSGVLGRLSALKAGLV